MFLGAELIGCKSCQSINITKLFIQFVPKSNLINSVKTQSGHQTTDTNKILKFSIKFS